MIFGLPTERELDRVGPFNEAVGILPVRCRLDESVARSDSTLEVDPLTEESRKGTPVITSAEGVTLLRVAELAS